jgi:peptide/nickel transport system substrate-binding protein
MKTAFRWRSLVGIALGAALGVAMFTEAAIAQKQGGSITVGLETDIPGFDPLKVGVFDTGAE